MLIPLNLRGELLMKARSLVVKLYGLAARAAEHARGDAARQWAEDARSSFELTMQRLDEAIQLGSQLDNWRCDCENDGPRLAELLESIHDRLAGAINSLYSLHVATREIAARLPWHRRGLRRRVQREADQLYAEARRAMLDALLLLPTYIYRVYVMCNHACPGE